MVVGTGKLSARQQGRIGVGESFLLRMVHSDAPWVDRYGTAIAANQTVSAVHALNAHVLVFVVHTGSLRLLSFVQLRLGPALQFLGVSVGIGVRVGTVFG